MRVFGSALALALTDLQMLNLPPLSWSSMAAFSMMIYSVLIWRILPSQASPSISNSRTPTWRMRLTSQVGCFLFSHPSNFSTTPDMGAVGLAVIDPHFVRESNIEDCVIEAVGQVRSRTPVCREETQILFLEGWTCHKWSSP